MIRLMFCALTISLTGNLAAQEVQRPADPPVIASLSLGLGPGLSGRDFSGQAVFTVSHSSGDYMIRSSTSSDFELFREAESATDVAVLFGRRMRGSNGWLRAAAGPGWVEVRERILVGCEEDVDTAPFPPSRCSEMQTRTAWGLSGQIDLVWGPVPAFGFGVAFLGNVNSQGSFGALTFNLFLGRNR